MTNIYDDRMYDHICAVLDGKKPTTQFLLATLLAGSIVITGAIFPNILSAFTPQRKTLSQKYKKRYSKEQLHKSLYYLKKQKYIRIVREKNGTSTLLITARGKVYITKLFTKNVQISQPKRWDKKWRVIIFDIPIEKNAARATLRRKIKELNFFQLQKSVWIYPYPCEQELLYIAHEYNVAEDVEIFTTEKLLHEKAVRAFFHL